MNSKVIENISLDIAIKIAKMCQDLHNKGCEDIIAERLLNSCVSVGVYMHDYECAESVSNATKYLNLALTELKYTSYWLDLMYETEVISYEVFESLQSDIIDLIKGIKETIKVAV